MDSSLKKVVFWIVILIAAVLLWEVVRGAREGTNNEISYSHFLSDVEAGNVENVTIAGQHIRGWYREGKGSFYVIGPSNPGVYLDALRNKNVEIRFGETQSGSLPMQLLGTWAPLILLAALWFFMIRQMQTRKGSSSPPGASPIEPK